MALTCFAWRDRSETNTSPGRELPQAGNDASRTPPHPSSTQQTKPKTPHAALSKTSASPPSPTTTSRRDGAERFEPVARPGTWTLAAAVR